MALPAPTSTFCLSCWFKIAQGRRSCCPPGPAQHQGSRSWSGRGRAPRKVQRQGEKPGRCPEMGLWLSQPCCWERQCHLPSSVQGDKDFPEPGQDRTHQGSLEITRFLKPEQKAAAFQHTTTGPSINGSKNYRTRCRQRLPEHLNAVSSTA